MSKFDKAILALVGMTVLFGLLWCSFIFLGIDPDGVKDITLEFAGALVTLITVRVIQKPNKDNKKD